MKTVLIMAGGTGGHIYPALAVSSCLLAEGVKVVWLGTRIGLESELVSHKNIVLEWINVKGVRGKGLLRSIGALLLALIGFWQALLIIRRHRPDVLLGMGGYVAGPGALAGFLARLPLVIHEANARAGLTNRLLSLLSTNVLTGFPDTPGLGRCAEWVGNPVRSAIVATDLPSKRDLGKYTPLRLLVIGGSQGAEIFNSTVPEAIAQLPIVDRPSILHQSGQTKESITKQRYNGFGVKADVVDYIDDIAGAYQNSDLIICRSGAMTIAEITVAGLPAILVPFPSAVDDHQTCNANFLVHHGAAYLISQDDLSSVSLANVLKQLLGNPSRLMELAEKARSLACPDAAERVAEVCLEKLGA
ncbi:MAG: undecaprenyldiphospho-muramoylpentapeptide beta-N-acetylglucosaminyltransferase [Acidiferrobacteraceae bacterium]|nr:undecaprenyldiphospho-muramoylpentapeptide beta-N-acetylglucosaminyltransferase [Acidiferrobacteraceae bacterium]